MSRPVQFWSVVVLVLSTAHFYEAEWSHVRKIVLWIGQQLMEQNIKIKLHQAILSLQ